MTRGSVTCWGCAPAGCRVQPRSSGTPAGGCAAALAAAGSASRTAMAARIERTGTQSVGDSDGGGKLLKALGEAVHTPPPGGLRPRHVIGRTIRRALHRDIDERGDL